MRQTIPLKCEKGGLYKLKLNRQTGEWTDSHTACHSTQLISLVASRGKNPSNWNWN